AARRALQSAAPSRRDANKGAALRTGQTQARMDRATTGHLRRAPRALPHLASAHRGAAPSLAAARGPIAPPTASLRARAAHQRRTGAPRLFLLPVPRKHPAALLHAILGRSDGALGALTRPRSPQDVWRAGSR